MATKTAAKKIAADPAVLQDAARPAAEPEKAEPKAKFAENDNSIDARMWRLLQDHKRMGSR